MTAKDVFGIVVRTVGLLMVVGTSFALFAAFEQQSRLIFLQSFVMLTLGVHLLYRLAGLDIAAERVHCPHRFDPSCTAGSASAASA